MSIAIQRMPDSAGDARPPAVLLLTLARVARHRRVQPEHLYRSQGIGVDELGG